MNRVEVIVFPDVKRIARDRAAKERQRRALVVAEHAEQKRRARDARRPQVVITVFDANGDPVK